MHWFIPISIVLLSLGLSPQLLLLPQAKNVSVSSTLVFLQTCENPGCINARLMQYNKFSLVHVCGAFFSLPMPVPVHQQYEAAAINISDIFCQELCLYVQTWEKTMRKHTYIEKCFINRLLVCISVLLGTISALVFLNYIHVIFLVHISICAPVLSLDNVFAFFPLNKV